MIRMNTVNPPGNELQVAKLPRQHAQGGGDRDAPVRAGAGSRGARRARSRATGSKQPVLIMGHMDVVGVERAHWSVDPFAAEIKDGYLYGRGAIDDKGMLAANLETMLLLKRNVDRQGRHALARRDLRRQLGRGAGRRVGDGMADREPSRS